MLAWQTNLRYGRVVIVKSKTLSFGLKWVKGSDLSYTYMSFNFPAAFREAGKQCHFSYQSLFNTRLRP